MKFWSVYDKNLGVDRLFNDNVIGRQNAAKFASTQKNPPDLIEIKNDPFDDEDNVEYFIDTDENSMVN